MSPSSRSPCTAGRGIEILIASAASLEEAPILLGTPVHARETCLREDTGAKDPAIALLATEHHVESRHERSRILGPDQPRQLARRRRVCAISDLDGMAPMSRPSSGRQSAMIKTIFAQETAREAHDQWNSVAEALRERAPKLAALMDAAREDVLAYTAFPREHWPQISSTNPLERLNGEIKRRSDVVGIFPNDAAVVRLTGALMIEQNDEWVVGRRYMSLESLAPISNDPVIRLPGVAA